MPESKHEEARILIDGIWDEEIVPILADYIRIPNKSPAFDADWAAHGYMDQAVALFADWAREKLVHFPGATLDIVRLEGRTPLIFIDVPGASSGTILMYGHLDKQPEMEGWAEGMGPWQPVIKDGKLYGRGGADDGYALFASLTALLAAKRQGIAHARTVILIEASEESGSPDLPAYIHHLKDRIGTPDLVICLDSSCGNYEQMWLTTSLRGLVMGNLSVRVLREGLHSGAVSGIVPSSFRILRSLIERIESAATGEILLPELIAEIPEGRRSEARQAAAILADQVWSELPLAGSTRPMGDDNAALILARSWKPQLAVTAIDGYPKPADGGNVLLPFSVAKLSMRLPPTVDAARAVEALKTELERDPPYGASVSFDIVDVDNGWSAPELADWLRRALDEASLDCFGAPTAFHGEGGSIPFMGMLGEKFPGTQFVVTGVLGPQSNAHGPNEFLHIAFAKKLTLAISLLIGFHADQKQGD
ncbi:peptidase M20 [Sphingomonas sp. Root710]|uniref:M20/M25/M40 family metallo-hydrolase n=1 Tax=Sphingomonas sp. Root710 TaxID=1736594 RepID=UPI0006FBF5C2|nr:M20/M25/M40 family metallo-hydrolase [Sphingomonas sp. Root710]KRB82911.1 peptidase M20 [Sphingomonas sp. Root710]